MHAPKKERIYEYTFQRPFQCLTRTMDLFRIKVDSPHNEKSSSADQNSDGESNSLSSQTEGLRRCFVMSPWVSVTSPRVLAMW